MTDQPQQPQQPDARPETRIWLISSAFGSLGYAVAQEALKLGDYVVAGCKREEIELERRTSAAQDDGSREDSEDEGRSIQYLKRIGGDSCIIVELDTRNVSLCQSALAEAINVWGRIDVILNCDSKTYAGTLEELNPTHILDQFESNFFGPINMMKSALPFLRKQRGGHIVNVTGLTGHMGTPGLSARCASDHALEGFTDALAYEIAPFNIKVSIVQPPLEVNVLLSPLHLQPSAQQAYNDPTHPFRNMTNILSLSPPPEHIMSETVSIILHIAALENPPGRIVVGNEGIEQVKDRVKTVSEELEEFLEASLGADIPKE
ncbi:uncharacterized protein LAJ45_05949 [Morchella importuna]|uniref:uncharacterized protein n=1 Tax=Morchella importuna TaxID=1174673 RepID=UPI001E8DEA9E|nr:uncharacterized protein LAJ45_05949 [Morchella importuna]KAH8149797.1 hypothetical protein LAJ45_05949 [Morchella importuna]